MGLLAFTLSVRAGNLVVNGGFEDGLTGWEQGSSGSTGSGSISCSTGWDDDGDHEVRLYRDLGDYAAEISQMIGIPRGCRVGFRARLTGGNHGTYGSGWAEV